MCSAYDELLRSLAVERFRRSNARGRGTTDQAGRRPSPGSDDANAGDGFAVPANSPARLALRVEDVAQLLDVGRTRVYDLIRTGDLPSVKIGGSRRVLVAEVHRYLERLSAEPETAPRDAW